MKRLISLLAVSAIAAGSGNAQNDPALPRLPKPIIVAEALASKLVKLENTSLVAHALDPEKAIDHFLFYYSAEWSPSCQRFTPALKKFYEEAKAAGANFEIVFVSRDDTGDAMLHYMLAQKMPWPAVRFDQLKQLNFLKQTAGRGVPCLVALDSHGLILAHSYRRGKKYLGPEPPLKEFIKLIGFDKAAPTTAPNRKPLE